MRPAHVDGARIARAFALTTLFGLKTTPSPAFAIDEHEVRTTASDDKRIAVGRITVKHLISARATTYAFAALHRGGPSVEGGTRVLSGPRDADDEPEELVATFERDGFEAAREQVGRRFPGRFDSLRVLPIDDRTKVVKKIIAVAVTSAESVLREVFARNAPLLTELAETAVRPPPALTVATRVILEADLARAARRDPPDTRTMRSLVAEAKAENVAFDQGNFAFQLGRALAKTCAELESDPTDDGKLGRLADMIEIARKLSPSFDFSIAQDLAWTIVREETPIAGVVREGGRIGAWREIARALRVSVP